jgi:hypothetical protein
MRDRVLDVILLALMFVAGILVGFGVSNWRSVRSIQSLSQEQVYDYVFDRCFESLPKDWKESGEWTLGVIQYGIDTGLALTRAPEPPTKVGTFFHCREQSNLWVP